MSEIMSFLEKTDEEYLIGLTNKGIVKRSHKDLETESVELSTQGEEIRGRIGEVEVMLKLPLTESVCSCPSSSVCKHIVMTILAAKKSSDEKKAQEISADTIVQETAETAQMESTAEKLQRISLEELKKMVPAKEWKAALELWNAKKPVSFEEGAFVTVCGADGTTVKLSEPLAYSTCNVCHDDKLCRHKVWGALSYLLDRGVFQSEQLALLQKEDEAEAWDEENLTEVLKDLKFFLREMLMVGCARLSPETPLGLERFAIRCHGAGLADLEGKMRAFADKVKDYQMRRAKVTVQDLLGTLTQCYFLVDRTERAISAGESIQALTGSFRTEYRDIADMTLCGVGIRQFASDAGYQGHTLYFVEEETGRFFTYTVARPTIYDGRAKHVNLAGEVPWNLPCTLAQLARSRIRLTGGKANPGGRLSSSNQSRAELLGNEVKGAELMAFVHEDFELLWKEYLSRVTRMAGESAGFGGTGDLEETEKLFLIKPKEIVDMHFDEISQCLLFYLKDGEGRRLLSKIRYSKQEEAAIRSLERMEREFREKREKPIFLGVLYVEGGEGIFYPIEALG